MVNITIVELNVEDGSFSADLPFSGLSGLSGDDEEEREVEEEATEESGSRGLALLGVLVLMVGAVAAIKYLSGSEEEQDVEIETGEDSVDVSIDD